MGVAGVNISGEKRYEGVIKVQCYQRYKGVGGGPISRKKRYVTLELPLMKQDQMTTLNKLSKFKGRCTFKVGGTCGDLNMLI